MKKMKLSASALFMLANIIGGAAWIGVGICGIIENRMATVIRIILLLVEIMIAFVMIINRKVEGEEKTVRDLEKAKAGAASLMHYLFCILAIAAPIIIHFCEGTAWNWSRIMSYSCFILMGIMNLASGTIFWLLSNNEDE